MAIIRTESDMEPKRSKLFNMLNNGEWWHIAGVWNDCESLKASECNANLISAAPELLAALEAGVDNEISMIDWMKMARVAIAKAKGLQ